MRILVVSDTHGDFYSLKHAVAAQPKAEAVIHCGDGAGQAELLPSLCPGKRIVAVRGNCDWSSQLPPTETVELGGKRIFVTHGHLYRAKFTLTDLVYAAREQQADILLFGHTHQALTDYQDGLTIMNPGACGGYGATYGILEITPQGSVVTNIVPVKK